METSKTLASFDGAVQAATDDDQATTLVNDFCDAVAKLDSRLIAIELTSPMQEMSDGPENS